LMFELYTLGRLTAQQSGLDSDRAFVAPEYTAHRKFRIIQQLQPVRGLQFLFAILAHSA
jgi:hypothetical protein